MSTFSLAAQGGREMERENKHRATHVWSLITPGARANCLPSFTPSPTNSLTNNITAAHSDLNVCTRSCLISTSDLLNVGERRWNVKTSRKSSAAGTDVKITVVGD